MMAELRHGYAKVSEEATIHYVSCGSGEPLLLLHGHPEHWRMWHKVIPSLSEHFTVIAADVKG